MSLNTLSCSFSFPLLWNSDVMTGGIFVIVIQIPEAQFCFLIFKKKKEKIRNTDFCCSDWVNSIDLSSSSLILFSITSLPLLNSSSKLFLCVSDILSFSSLNSTQFFFVNSISLQKFHIFSFASREFVTDIVLLLCGCFQIFVR